MHLIINSQTLAHEVRLLNKIVASKSSLPVLANIRVEALDNAITLAATDLQVALTTTCVAQVQAPGAITLPAKKLSEMLEQIPNADIELSLDGPHVRLQCGSFKSRLQALSALEFPALASPEGIAVTLPSGSFKSMIERTSYAISDKTAQYVLKGALLSINGEVFALVATDGKRLSIATAACPESPSMSAIIPQKALEALIDHCTGKSIEFSHSDRHLFFVAGQRTLISRTLDGQFPKYDRIIPKDCDKTVTIDRIAFAAALRRVGTVDMKAVGVGLTQGILRLTARSAEIGDADEQLGVGYTGPDLRWQINGGYVLDFLDHASQPGITIDVKNERTPMLFTDGPDFVNVIMGMLN